MFLRRGTAAAIVVLGLMTGLAAIIHPAPEPRGTAPQQPHLLSTPFVPFIEGRDEEPYDVRIGLGQESLAAASQGFLGGEEIHVVTTLEVSPNATGTWAYDGQLEMQGGIKLVHGFSHWSGVVERGAMIHLNSTVKGTGSDTKPAVIARFESSGDSRAAVLTLDIG